MRLIIVKVNVSSTNADRIDSGRENGEVSLVRLRPVWMINRRPSVLWHGWVIRPVKTLSQKCPMLYRVGR